MKQNVLSIEINKPVEVVFEATANPANTSKWVPNILEEKMDAPTTKIGTIYRQRWKGGKETAMIITGYILNKQLDFHSVNGTYRCMYRYEPTQNGTKLTYSEDNGVDEEIDGPFTMEILQKLKRLIEER